MFDLQGHRGARGLRPENPLAGFAPALELGVRCVALDCAVTRDGVRGEGIPGGYGAVYGQLRALETLGVCRRGYFVEGLGGAQFALPGAVERLRELRPREDEEPEETPDAEEGPATLPPDSA